MNAIRRQLDVPLAIDESRSLEELVLFVQQADLVLGVVDTGAMQIAALAERPQVVLFTPRHAIQWAPGQPNAQVILPDAGPHVTGITFDQVCQAIARLRPR